MDDGCAPALDLLASYVIDMLTAEDFKDSPHTVCAPDLAFYVAFGRNGKVARCVSVTDKDRHNVAALVANWIAEGYQPMLCDARALAKHARALAQKAQNPAKTEAPAELEADELDLVDELSDPLA